MKNQSPPLLKCLWLSVILLAATYLTAQNHSLHVLVIGAHPDDADLCAGGTASLWASMGHQVKFLSLTNGDAGHQAMGGGALAKRRRAEAKESARRLGIAEYEVLDNHDGELIPSLDVRLQVIRRIRRWNADVVIVSRPNDYHPDHRNTGLVVQDAAYMVIVPNVASDTPPLKKNPVFLYCEDRFQKPTPFEADIAVNIDAVVEKKVDALDAHVSQFYEWLPWTMGRFEEVPKDKIKRKQWLTNWRTRPIKPATKKSLTKWYGQVSADEAQNAEAFEICEYGVQPNDDRVKELFPMLGKSNPTIVSHKTMESIKVDGVLDEDIYQKAYKVFLKNSMDKQLVDDAGYSTSVQIFHDDAMLYIAFSASDKDIHSSFTKRDEHLWKEEAVEVFIDTDTKPDDYLEVEVSPNNILYDSWIIDPENIDVAATKKYDLNAIKTAVQVKGSTNNRNDTDQNWTVEMAIPFEELIKDYDPSKLQDYEWKINFYRLNQDASPLKYMAWSPTQGSFHQPDKFGTVIFRD